MVPASIWPVRSTTGQWGRGIFQLDNGSTAHVMDLLTRLVRGPLTPRKAGHEWAAVALRTGRPQPINQVSLGSHTRHKRSWPNVSAVLLIGNRQTRAAHA